ncbi:MAG TPA: 4-hydroxyphenylacetate 3-hydroxylase N-terminal domain-containing protein [Rhodopila sp.]|uniref:4-hydroxyphenylacetate 3-hydroxylase family protein n=1 Tax=Rhodopila sp. TaxID=2480087 RepID=UPI002C95D99E|nr:4-hydroxyphenylacetate 3-hydroxylase N-terminal domain-containing protein [Rhodopila sp.]HVY14210.1 4-hydroxyphenylacetate 3-hydroxylase N-terminal domain-containing protein [Rhodopila sp.]
MPARTGAAFLRGLRDDRQLWLGGRKVTDPLDHPALRGAAESVAAVYDLQHQYPDDCLTTDEENGETIAVSHIIPRSKADLALRHKALRRVAEFSVGLMGRTPDYMNVTYAGFAGRSDEWGANGNEAGAANLVAFQKEMRRRDLSLTHTLIHAMSDKSKGNVPTGLDVTQLHKVEDTEHGILVRGARVLATLAPFADEIAVYPSQPMPNASARHALSFCIPMATPGLTFICRDSVSCPGSLFDHPLSARFDEQDAFVIFDNVEVPRHRVFVDGNLAVYNTVMSTSWRGNAMQQTMIRAWTKLEFAYGIATRMAEAIGANDPNTQQMLGEIWTYAEMTRAAVVAGETGAYEHGNGAWFLDRRPMDALRAMLPYWFPRVNEIIRLIGSHNVLATPAAADFADPSLRPLIDTYLRGAGDVSAEERARLFRLGWDFAGSALASRNEQYERFYLTSGARNRQGAHLRADRAEPFRLVDRFLRQTP